MDQQERPTCPCTPNKPKPILFFCINNKCLHSRIVCLNCQKKHKQHLKITYDSDQSFDMLNLSQNAKDKKIIKVTIDALVEKVQKVKDKIAAELNGLVQLVEQILQGEIKQQLQFFKKAINKELPRQIRSLIVNPQTTAGKLNRIAEMMRKLNRPDFSDSLWVQKMKEYMEESISMFQNNISQPIEQLRKQLLKLESLYPFSQGIAKTIKLAEAQVQIATMKKIQQARREFLNAFGEKKSIKEYEEIDGIKSYSDYQRIKLDQSWTLNQWLQNGKTCQEIRAIDLSQANLESIPKQLSLFPSLVDLDLADNKIKDVEPLKILTQLKAISLNNNNLTEIGELSKLNNLVLLYLGSNSITEIGELSKLNNLVILDLQHNNITEIRELSKLNNLVVLDLDNNSITEIGGISNLTNLAQLSLAGNPIKSLENIHQLKKLEQLNISTKNFENPEQENKKIKIVKKNKCEVKICQ